MAIIYKMNKANMIAMFPNSTPPKSTGPNTTREHTEPQSGFFAHLYTYTGSLTASGRNEHIDYNCFIIIASAGLPNAVEQHPDFFQNRAITYSRTITSCYF